MTVRRCILQSRGWEDAQTHRAETLVLAAPQETPSMFSTTLTVTLSDTAVHHMSAGRSTPSYPPLPGADPGPSSSLLSPGYGCSLARDPSE